MYCMRERSIIDDDIITIFIYSQNWLPSLPFELIKFFFLKKINNGSSFTLVLLITRSVLRNAIHAFRCYPSAQNWSQSQLSKPITFSNNLISNDSSYKLVASMSRISGLLIVARNKIKRLQILPFRKWGPQIGLWDLPPFHVDKTNFSLVGFQCQG